MNISVIEDELLLWVNIKTKLENQWYQVRIYTSYRQFMRFWNSSSHLYIIDIWLVDGSWFDIIEWLRKKKNSVAPIIITSGYGDTDRIVYGLNIGADDYMVKPCIPDELVARVDALARRNIVNPKIPETLGNFVYKDITYIPHTQEIWQRTTRIFLSKKEMLIFEIFIRNPKIIISRETIIEKAWSTYNSASIPDTVLNTALSRIRKKFWESVKIKSLYSFWYILE